MNSSTDHSTSLILNMKYFFPYLFIGLGVGCYFPILGFYLEYELFFTGTQIGLILASTALFQIVAMPVWGILTDYIKSPKRTLSISLVFCSLTIFVLMFVSSFIAFISFIILFTLFRAPIFYLYDEMILSISKIKVVNYGFIRAGGSIGFAVAAFIGFFFSKFFDYNIFFLLSAVFFISAVTIIFFIRDVEYNKPRIHIKRDLPFLFTERSFVLLCLLIFITIGVLETNMSLMGNYLKDFGGSDFQIALAIFLSASIELPVLTYSKRLYQYISFKKIVVIITILNIAKYLILYFFDSVALVLILAPVHGITYGLIYPLFIYMVEAMVPKKILSTSLSLLNAFVALGTTVFVYTSGVLEEFTKNINTIFILFIILYVFNFILLLAFRQNNKEIQKAT
ncbi:MFS transporter [Haloplasma contractile]|uniref:Multidrug efflux transporter protein n=1 Tax=Haloplasma contractile SSD-17B TaxID=1033810 RepID=U2FLY5_9MOLU|nr:MFS transporter [Haloplasma contractile]ERJ13750.1 Multidrug efflux transporter protein [Haloplasma contractile SSD-17B]